MAQSGSAVGRPTSYGASHRPGAYGSALISVADSKRARRTCVARGAAGEAAVVSNSAHCRSKEPVAVHARRRGRSRASAINSARRRSSTTGSSVTHRSKERRSQAVPRGDKSSYTDKQKRKAAHIEAGYEARCVKKEEAERRAWATVNKESGGGNKSGSGRGKPESHASSRKGGRKGGAAAASRTAEERSASARKAAATRKRNAAAKH